MPQYSQLKLPQASYGRTQTEIPKPCLAALQSTDPIFSVRGGEISCEALPWRAARLKVRLAFSRADDDQSLERLSGFAMWVARCGRSETLARLCLGRGEGRDLLCDCSRMTEVYSTIGRCPSHLAL